MADIGGMFKRLNQLIHQSDIRLADADETYLVLDTIIHLLIEHNVCTEEEFLAMKERLRPHWKQ